MKKNLLLYVIFAFWFSLTNAQNVGISNDPTFTSPQSPLHIYWTTDGNLLQLSRSSAANTGLTFSVSSGNFSILNQNNNALIFGTNATERMRITNSGNIGIGTTTPSAQLHTTGTVRFSNYSSGANGAILRTNSSGDLNITNFTGVSNDVLLGNGAFGSMNNLAWQLTGNSGTNPTNNFIGTTDAQDLVFRTQNTERMRILSAGNLLVNRTTALYATDLAEFQGNATFPDALNAYTSVANATAIYGESSAAGGTGVWGLATNDANSWGVWGYSRIGIGVFGQATEEGGVAFYGRASTASRASAFIVNNHTSGTAIIGAGNNITAPFILTAGSGGAFGGTTIGLYAYKLGNYINNTGAGYFVANTNNGEGVYIAYRSGNTNYKIINVGSFGGTVSTDVWGLTNDTNDRKIMFAPEAPEIVFHDFGTSKLINGKAHVDLDPIFSRNIVVNKEHPLRVFIQLEGECNGVYVTNKTKEGFDVIELNNGTSNVEFTWFVIANRADYINPITNELISKHEGIRFPQAPNPPKIKTVKDEILKEEKLKKIKKINEN